MEEKMNRLEFLTTMLSIQALLDVGEVDKVKQIVAEVISEARKSESTAN